MTLAEQNELHAHYQSRAADMAVKKGTLEGAMQAILSTAQQEFHSDTDWNYVCWVANMALEKIGETE